MPFSDTPRAEASLSKEAGLKLRSAVGLGIAASVGGGVLALAGVAIALAGPSASLAIVLNALIGLLAASSLAELGSAFPESGGTYVFARKVMSVRAAFAVGWVVSFASIGAAVFFAMGFAAFASTAVSTLFGALSPALAEAVDGRWLQLCFVVLATLLATWRQFKGKGSGGRVLNLLKLLLFALIIVSGPVALLRGLGAPLSFQPFFAGGSSGLLLAMGYLFIAMQGFALISTVSGELEEPKRNLFRAMALTLAASVLIYVPLLLSVLGAGFDSADALAQACLEQPEAVVVLATRRGLGELGLWLVLLGGLLAMFSALEANLMAASKMIVAMAHERTLPARLERRDERYQTPRNALFVVAVLVLLISAALPNVGVAGAASSVAVLLSFVCAHLIAGLAEWRGGVRPGVFRPPGARGLRLFGALLCASFAVALVVAVPIAGWVTLSWIFLGLGMYLGLFAERAEAVDAGSQVVDPQLARFRGRNPWVLVPVANPRNAAALVDLAHIVAPPRDARILLLNVITPPDAGEQGSSSLQLDGAHQVLQSALDSSFSHGYTPELLLTLSRKPWDEIQRLARGYQAETLLMGFPSICAPELLGELENVMSATESDVVLLRAPMDWKLETVQRVLVPLGGRHSHDIVRARLLGGLFRNGAEREVSYAMCLAADAGRDEERKALRYLERFAGDHVPKHHALLLSRSDDPVATIVAQANDHDLMILGVRRLGRRRAALGDKVLDILRQSDCAVVLICHHD
ncbi:MAG: amino acid permease [Myxococcota bacterium]|jgi:amino acid transporter/nucleotide-binding universal stress UspA family protein|nr:amino acid permease [Myxococcota bacterium]